MAYYELAPSRHTSNVDRRRGQDLNYAMYLDQIQDRYGNTVKIQYQNDISAVTAGTEVRNVQELQPASISWGPGGQRSVAFKYEPLPSSNRFHRFAPNGSIIASGCDQTITRDCRVR